MHIVAMGVVHFDTDAETFGFQQEDGFEVCETVGDGTVLLTLDHVAPPEDIVVILSPVGTDTIDHSVPERTDNAYPIVVGFTGSSPRDFEIVVFHY